MDVLYPVFAPFIPEFEYVLFDTKEHDDDELKQVLKSGALQASLLLLKYIYVVEDID
ncbi:Rpn family recombination-promoting nuclease/putative transposase [Chloroflexi bacterium TSY]|nr:Rpn family recombination-promoting nuclease/putative transposase [Chloroflexi bacterium TSY]